MISSIKQEIAILDLGQKYHTKITFILDVFRWYTLLGEKRMYVSAF